MIQLAAFDLDGTLLNDNRQVSETDYKTLCSLGNNGIVRVAATGRNFFSINRLLPDDFPIDYAVFSSGAGILDWKQKKILLRKCISSKQLKKVVEIFINEQVSFTVHKPVPETHHMLLHLNGSNPNDLKNYTHFYKDYIEEFSLDKLPKEATQFIALLNTNKAKMQNLRQQLNHLKTIVTTSPIDKKSLWLEVFNPEVSKGNGIAWLCNKLGLSTEKTFGIGNDYNDTDLLNFTKFSFAVDNAPESIKRKYHNVLSNNNSAFTQAINQVLNSD